MSEYSENESIGMFRDSARDFLGAADQRQRVRALEDAGGGFDRGTWRQIAELGWLSILVSEDDGGLGLGIAEVCAIATEVGRSLLPEPFIDAGVHPVALLARLPAGGLRDELLEGILSGGTVAGVAWQESAGELEADNGLASVAAQGDGVRAQRPEAVRASRSGRRRLDRVRRRGRRAGARVGRGVIAGAATSRRVRHRRQRDGDADLR